MGSDDNLQSVLHEGVENILFVNSNRHKSDLSLQSICQLPKSRGSRAEILGFIFGCALLLIAFTVAPLTHQDHGSQGRVAQAGILFWHAMTFYTAEILRRICLFIEEINHIETRYEGSVSRIVLHVFGSRPSANFGALLVIFSLGFINELDPQVMTEITSHWPMSVGLAGLYLILLSVVKITENLVDVDSRMDQGILGIGHGLAYSYYYGFLKIILPASETNKCFRDRAVHLEFEEKIPLATKKLLVLIPDTCFCTPSFQDMAPPGQIERVKSLEDVIVSRSGMKGRSYSSTVYLIQPEGIKTPVYVTMEMPSILYVLYEMNTIGDQNYKLSAFERTQQTQAFCSVLSKLLDNDPSCKEMYELIYYKGK